VSPGYVGPLHSKQIALGVQFGKEMLCTDGRTAMTGELITIHRHHSTPPLQGGIKVAPALLGRRQLVRNHARAARWAAEISDSDICAAIS